MVFTSILNFRRVTYFRLCLLETQVSCSVKRTNTLPNLKVETASCPYTHLNRPFLLLLCLFPLKFSLSHGWTSGENETLGGGPETGTQDEHKVGCQSSIGKVFLIVHCIPACCATLELPSTVFTVEQWERNYSVQSAAAFWQTHSYLVDKKNIYIYLKKSCILETTQPIEVCG